MAAYNQATALPEGATLIFGSWQYIADGAGGFSSRLAPTMEKKTTTSSIEELTQDLGEITLSDLVRGHEYESGSSSTRA